MCWQMICPVTDYLQSSFVVSGAERFPSPVHPSLAPLLLNLNHDWTSVTWMQWFNDFVTMA